MRVKIGDKWFDGAVEPIMIEFIPEEKELVSNMADTDNCFCVFPDMMSVEAVCEFMGTTPSQLTAYELSGKECTCEQDKL